MKAFLMSKGKGHIPMRTCISCGTKRRKSELIRLIVNSDGRVVADTEGKGSGRGAYVCRNRTCRNLLNEGKRLGKAFRRKARLEVHPSLYSGPSQ